MTCVEPYLIKRCEEIELLLKDASRWAASDEKVGAHLAAYITILIIGVFEDCIEHLFTQRVHKTGDVEVESYVVKVIGDRFRNPDYGAISGLLKEFSPEYQQKFRDKIAYDGKEATALESILSNKNSLAHCGTAKLEISIKEADEYFRRVIPILETIENILAQESRQQNAGETT